MHCSCRLALSSRYLGAALHSSGRRASVKVGHSRVIVLGTNIRRDKVSDILAELLDTPAQEHESTYRGVYTLIQRGSFVLKILDNIDPLFRNGDPPEEKHAYPEYSQFRVIIELDDENSQSELTKQLLECIVLEVLACAT